MLQVACEDEFERLTAEVNHRANNLLAVIHGIINLTDSEDVETYKASIRGRLESLSRTNSFLAGHKWHDVDFAQLVARHVIVARITCKGDPLMIKSKSAQSLGMIIHEMITNAEQHGALSVSTGRVKLRWLAHDGKFIMRWQESGGPLIQIPQFNALGWKIIESSMRQFRGKVEPDWRRDGLHCDFTCELSHL